MFCKILYNNRRFATPGNYEFALRLNELWENAKFELSELLVGIHWALTKR
jgi:hypothetical protein